MAKKPKMNIRADKPRDQWVVAMYCDYGKPGTKRLIRASYSNATALTSWNKFHKTFSRNGYRCWQEDKSGVIIRQSPVMKG